MSKTQRSQPQTTQVGPVRRPSKFYLVAIDKMRVPPALVTQREFRKAHGDRIAAELDLDKLGHPILNHRDGIFWILDGQHRIYAMKQNGFDKYDLMCEVYDALTDSEMADIFLGRDARRAISPFDKFHIACTAGYPRETAIRRAVETQGAKISREKKEDCITAVAAVGKVFDQAGGGHIGEVVLGQVVRTIRTGLVGDLNAFDGRIVEGLGMIFNRYNGKTNEKHLSAALSASLHGAGGILRRAKSQQERTGNQLSHCVAAAVVDLYNKQANRNSKLPSWWKEAEE